MTIGSPRRHPVASAALLLLTLASCAAREPEPPTADATRPPVSLVLSLADEAPGPIWLHESDAESQPRWVAVRRPSQEGPRVFLREQCAIPDCQGDGGVCGMALPVVRRLDPGDSIQYGWDGRTSRTVAEGRCEIREALPAGTYEVEFCWTDREPEPAVDPIEGQRLVDVTCAVRTVEMPGTRRVSLVVD